MHTLSFITHGSATLSDFDKILRGDIVLQLDPSTKDAIDRGANIIQRVAQATHPIYGVNTGFGKLANTKIAPENTQELQRNLILSHCCGVGPLLPAPIVRLILSLKLLSLSAGASGVRWHVITYLHRFLKEDCLPEIPSQGSVGASGDLAPLAHMTAALMGEGYVLHRGIRKTAQQALNDFNLPPLTLAPKEGLALINGTQASTAMALSGFFQTWTLACTALLSGALSTDAMMGTDAPFHPKIHELRGHQGQIEAARTLRALLQGSEILHAHQHEDDRVQDPYSLRCQPQVMGAVFDQLRFVARTLEIEANAVTDNPLILDDTNIISGGNFHAEPVAFAADQMALCLTEIGAISQRRIATIVDPSLNYNLPAFLSKQAGVNSGYMIAEVTSAALMSENKFLASPCVLDSTPTSANQEDHVSMAAHASYRLQKMIDNLSYLLGIEIMTAVQGLDFRSPHRSSPLLCTVQGLVRDKIPHLEQDRFLAPDLEKMADLIKQETLLAACPPTLFPQYQRS